MFPRCPKPRDDPSGHTSPATSPVIQVGLALPTNEKPPGTEAPSGCEFSRAPLGAAISLPTPHRPSSPHKLVVPVGLHSVSQFHSGAVLITLAGACIAQPLYDRDRAQVRERGIAARRARQRRTSRGLSAMTTTWEWPVSGSANRGKQQSSKGGPA
jgi:hypothetical protein